MEAGSVKQDWVFHPYMTHTPTHGLHNKRWEECIQGTPIQPSLIADSKHIVSDEKLYCVIRGDKACTPHNMIKKSTQSPAESEIRDWSGQIS